MLSKQIFHNCGSVAVTSPDVSRDEAGTPAAEPGTPENPLRLDDARMMRALAHPARIRILQHLALDGPATATECAEVAGLSPSACSYHLRALARYGFVDEDPASAADGRQRPWRARIISLTFDESEPDQPDALRAAGRLLTESMLARFDEMRAEYLDRAARYSAEWRTIAGWNQDVVHVTAAEAAELLQQIRDLLASYRRIDPAERPIGAHRVHTLLDLIPWFDPDDLR
jgi:DNA-binding transcriptional ArsR family regulator